MSGTARRVAHAGGYREDDEACPATVSNIVRGTEGRRNGRGHAHLGGRPPGLQRVSLSGDAGIVIGVDFRHTHLRVAVREPRPPGARRGVRAAGRRRVLGAGLRPGGAAGQPADRGDRHRPHEDRRSGPRRARPDRRGVRDAGLDRHPARLGRHPARRGAAGGSAWPVHGGQRRQPWAPWGAGLGQRPGVRDLAYIKVARRRRRGPGDQREDLSRSRRHGGRNRAYYTRRSRSRLPLRKPGLPGDLRRRIATCSRCSSRATAPT